MKKTTLLVFVAAMIAQPVIAADTGDVPDEVVEFAMKLARKHLTSAVVSDGSHVPPETAEELKKPIVPFEDAKRVVSRGRNSGLLEWCELDADAYYRDFMQYERSQRRWSDKQLAYIGLMHGLTQDHVLRSNREKKGDCPESLRAGIQAKLKR